MYCMRNIVLINERLFDRVKLVAIFSTIFMYSHMIFTMCTVGSKKVPFVAVIMKQYFNNA